MCIPAIVALQPYVAATTDSAPIPYLSRATSLRVDSPFPRLLSPIQLDSSRRSAPACSTRDLTAKSPPSPKRRSALDHGGPLQRRRLHCQRDCHFESIGAATFFDQLPWISAMDGVDQVNCWDIADLSQLKVSPRSTSASRPVRRRRSPLHPSPRTPAMENVPDHSPSWLVSPSTRYGCHRSSPPRTPRTPRSHFSPSRVRFHNLQPVFIPRNRHNGESNGCFSESD